MKPVLLVTDGSLQAGAAVAAAIELAQMLQTELVVVTVWDVAPDGFAATTEQLARRMNAEAAARAEEAGVPTRSVVLWGTKEVAAAATTLSAGLLVVASHGSRATIRRRFGSVSCPVLALAYGGERPLADAQRSRREQVLALAG